jgi:hypothetical protein
MPNITLKGVPPKLYRELKRLAEAEDRSLNREVIRRLEESVSPAPDRTPEVEAFIRRVCEQEVRYNASPPPPPPAAGAGKRKGRP